MTIASSSPAGNDAGGTSSAALQLDTAALFDSFVSASTFKTILTTFYQLCTALDIEPADGSTVYPVLRQFSYWKAQKLWKLLDKKVEHNVYLKQKAADRLNVLVVGAGPCGLRSAIEMALLGARVVVAEERDRFSRNNVLHLWEFVIHDLKSLGVKIFYPKFCAGSIEHISIRQLQCSLLKTALCLGVQIHEGVSFVRIASPEIDKSSQVLGFRAIVEPKNHMLSRFDIDVLIGADGKRNTIPGFPREEMRGRLAIGITANFVNKKTAAEERVPEISGVAYIFNQQFFKDMKSATGVDLENIVYYKDETHYFVMTAKKQSLLQLGVIKKDNEDVNQLLSADNVDREALASYAMSAADFATHGKLPLLEFAKNHRGHPDIAMFDFTSLFSSRCAVRLLEKHGKSLLMGIVGDSLHEPFWPTGSGCARGFLGVLDTAWLVREFGMAQRGILEILAERESVYRLLAQATKDNMHKSLSKYTVDPRTRYTCLEMTLQPQDVVDVICSDNPRSASAADRCVLNRSTSAHDMHLMAEYRLLRFVQIATAAFKLRVFDFDLSWHDGRVLGALLAKFRPKSIDYLSICAQEDVKTRVETVLDAVEEKLGVMRPCGSAMAWMKVDSTGWKKKYIEEVIRTIKKDSNGVVTSMITPRAHSLKRRIVEPLKIVVNSKKSGAIAELSASLFGGPKSFGQELNQALEQQQEKEKERVKRHDDRISRLAVGKEEDEVIRVDEFQVKVGSGEKLDPSLIEKVKKLVTGEHERESLRDMHDQKHRRSRSRGRLDANDVARLEQRLMSPQSKQNAAGSPMSSQEEKIIRTNAADARREANNGFSKEHETRRFQKYDDVIAQSDRAANRRELTGIDPFNRQRRATTAIVLNTGSTAPKKAPPTPQKSFTLENGENGPVIKPIASVIPKRQTTVVDFSYESLNPRKQEICKLCRKVVYLAERLQVGNAFVHKNCFRCAYCCQPLRIGSHSADKDLEYHYPDRIFYFCRTHMQIPLREKISRIGRMDRSEKRKKSEGDEEDVRRSRASSKNHDSSHSSSHSSDQENQLNLSSETKSKRDKSHTTLSYFSPDQMRTRTEQKIKDSALAVLVSSNYDNCAPSQCTPERAEFGSHLRSSRPASVLNCDTVERATLCDSDSSDDEIADEIDSSDNVNEAFHEASSGDISTEDSSEEGRKSVEHEDEEEIEDELEDEDVAEIERTMNELADAKPGGRLDVELDKEELVKTVLERINHRRSILGTPAPSKSPTTTPRSRSRSRASKQMSIQDETIFYTPAVSFRTRGGVANNVEDDDDSRARAVSIAVDSAIGGYEKYMTPCATHIQKEKIGELERLRSEARQRAKLKTDEQLGIDSATATSSSNPRLVAKLDFSAMTADTTGRSSTVSPPTNRGKKVTDRAKSMLDQMPSMRRPMVASVSEDLDTSFAPPALPESSPPELNEESQSRSRERSLSRPRELRSRSRSRTNEDRATPSALPLMTSTPRRPVTTSAAPVPHQPMGLLATLFSPSATRRSPASKIPATPPTPAYLLDVDRLHCESRKETSMLGNAARIKLRQRKNEPAQLHLPPLSTRPALPSNSEIEEDRGETKVPCVAVAPSPRKAFFEALEASIAGTSSSFASMTIDDDSRRTSSISMSASPSDRAARLIAAKADKMIRQREEDRRRSEQDLQRGLQECEVRLETLRTKGAEIETKLRLKPTDKWLLDCWQAMVQEQTFLKWRQQSLVQRKEQLELELYFKELNDELNKLADDDEEKRETLLSEMLSVTGKKRDAKTRFDESSRQNSRLPRGNATRLTDISHDFRNATAVFT